MSKMHEKEILKDVYALMAELLCSPYDADEDSWEIKKDAGGVIEMLASIDQESAALLSRFLQENAISEEDYIDLFELEPKCPLYLGSHTYDEPKTCANAGVSDRNGYMIELIGIYKHFGRMPNGKELPDYLPLMLDFLSMTVESKDDPVRGKYIKEYILPFLPPMHARLEGLKTPYLNLLEAFEKVLKIELKTNALSKQPKQKEETYVG